MAKKTKRLAVRYEKDQSGCMWGLISLFDFRHGRSSRKLIADKKRANRHTVASGNSSNKFEILANLDEDCNSTLESEECKKLDVGKPSVKKLIEEEMFSEQDAKKTDSGDLKTDQKKTKKCHKKSHDMDADSLNAAENLKEQTVNSLPVDLMLKEIYCQIHRKSTSERKFDHDDKANMQSNEYLADLEEKVVEAIKEYLCQKFDIGKDFNEIHKVQQSREIMDALQIPHSDEELFLELAQNPNSVLLKYIRNLHNAVPEKVEKLRSHEFKEVMQSEELVDHKQSMFFRRKAKHQGRNQPKGNQNSDASSKIVILKPGPKGFVNSEADSIHLSANYKRKVPNEKVGSHFSLAEIKRKFKYAIGKDQHGLSTNFSDGFACDHQKTKENEKGVLKENVARNSTTKDRFFIERIARPLIDGKRGEKTGKSKDLEISQDIGNISHNRRGLSNIYVEAKKHLSEMLSSGDEGVDFLSGHKPKTLGRILSLPEYNFSPISSPRRDCKHGSITSETRYSAGIRLLNGKETMQSPRAENDGSYFSPGKSQMCNPDDSSKHVHLPEDNHNIVDDTTDQSIREDIASSSKDETCFEGDIEISKENESATCGERSVLDAPSDSNDSSPSREGQNGVMPDACHEKRVTDVPSDLIASSLTREDQIGDTPDFGEEIQPFTSLTQDSSKDNQLSLSPSRSPSSNSTVRKGDGDLEAASDVPERPSPVSVLEPQFLEDNMSPVHAMSMSGLLVQPVHIQFEDRDHTETDKFNITKTCKEDKEVISDYVKAVLLASGLNWNEIFVNWFSSEQLLDLSLIDEVALSPNQLCCDRKLLFDCINEVLVDICLSYPPWLSVVKPCLRSILDWEEDVVEVCEGVYWHLAPLPQPLTLDHLVRKDMSRARAWMNLHSDAETIGIETCEAIFEDLVEDTISSCVLDSPDCEADFTQRMEM